MSYAFRCEVCDADPPHWRITRIGDVVLTWACDAHLAVICERLQRDFEITELIVQDSRKMREWAETGKTLAQIASPGE